MTPPAVLSQRDRPPEAQRGAPARVAVDAAGATDVGCAREENQDQFLIARLGRAVFVLDSSLALAEGVELVGPPEAWLLAVADGMGGLSAGQRASAVVLEACMRHVLQGMPAPFGVDDARHPVDLREPLEALVERARGALLEEARGRRDGALGSTLTLAYVLWPRLHLAHVGDSRCYLLRDGRATQLTQDHTVAQQLADGGVLAPREAQRRYGHVLVNALTSAERPEAEGPPQVGDWTLRRGDRLLLCSDGLTRHLEDAELASTVTATEDAAEAARALVERARERGGADNITAVVARFE